MHASVGGNHSGPNVPVTEGALLNGGTGTYLQPPILVFSIIIMPPIIKMAHGIVYRVDRARFIVVSESFFG